MADAASRTSLLPGRTSLVPGADAIALAAKEMREHPSAAALGALVFDVVSRQGEARTLFSGKEFVERRAEEHGVTPKTAETSVGDLLAVLERGAESDAERHLLSVFALRGLRDRLREVEGAERLRRHASSGAARRSFCGQCGNMLLFEGDRWPGETHVARAAIAGEIDRAPQAHVYWDDRARWLTLRDELPKLGGPTGVEPLSPE